MKEKHEQGNVTLHGKKTGKKESTVHQEELHSVFIKDGYRMQGLCMVLPLMKRDPNPAESRDPGRGKKIQRFKICTELQWIQLF